MKRMIKRILFPNKLIGFLVFNAGFGMLIYVFVNRLEKTLLAYISYAISFYALVIFCIWFYKVCKSGNVWIKKHKLYHTCQKHYKTFIRNTMYYSLVFNLIYGLLKLGIGIYYHSWWFISFACYYLLLCVMRTYLVKNINNHEREYQILKHTGILLMLLNIILIGIIILILKQDRSIAYSGYFIYVVALYDFYLIISAAINVIKYRKNHNPVIAAGKCINLTVAMISMVSLETAMIYQFGNNDAGFKLTMTSSMGFAICIINSCMALYMIVRANKHLK